MSFASLLIGCLEVLLFIWDVLTYPLYFLIQQPWKQTRRIEKTRARIVNHQANEITIRASPIVNKVKDELRASPDDINTMERVFDFSVKKFGHKTCLGTRAVLGEMEEKQNNGKVFTKLQLGDYSWLTYQEVQSQAINLGKGFRELGVNPRQKIVLYANTCAEWMVSALAAFNHSLAVVTIYTNLGEDGVEHGIAQTDASLVVVSQELLARLMSVLPKCNSVTNVIIIPSHNPIPTPDASERTKFHKYSDILTMGSSSLTTSSPPDPEDTAIIMYTSGSTGVPKGVVLTHSNLVHALLSVIPTVCDSIGSVRANECYIAILPLAHVLELLAENLMLLMGIPIGYSSTKTFTDTGTAVAKGSKGDAGVLKPTIVCVVPLVLDSVYKGIRANVSKRSEFFRLLVDLCYKYRLKWIRLGHDTPIMNQVIFNKFKAILGGKLRILLSGGAPLAPDAHDFCRTCLGITLLQGYGLTETTATACIPDGSDLSTGRVGAPLQDVDIKLVNWEEGGYTVSDQQGARGEIIIGGGHVAKEYYKMADKTEEEFFNENGKRWFRTGDIGQMMTDGTIMIIDRKKDLLKLQGGEYVSLSKVESLLKLHPAIDNICVCGDSGQSFTVALIIPGQAFLGKLAEKLNLGEIDRESICSNKEIIDEFTSEMIRHGIAQRLAKFEIPKAVHLIAEPWTPESGLITAAMKLKRKALGDTYSSEIVNMYDANNNKAGPVNVNNNNSKSG